MIVFPKQLISPVASFLRDRLLKLKKQKKVAEMSDPIRDPSRLSANSLEEDVDEQVGHDNARMRVGFIDRQMVQVKKALTRLKVGNYGQCEICKKMIDTDRLMVYPETTLCLSCQKERE